MSSWIKKRYKCNSDSVFRQLYEQVKKDIAEINELNKDHPNGLKFILSSYEENQSDDFFMIERSLNDSERGNLPFVEFQKIKNTIGINNPLNNSSFYVECSWNPEKLKCEYTIKCNDNATEDSILFKKIIPKVLENFFFRNR